MVPAWRQMRSRSPWRPGLLAFRDSPHTPLQAGEHTTLGSVHRGGVASGEVRGEGFTVVRPQLTDPRHHLVPGEGAILHRVGRRHRAPPVSSAASRASCSGDGSGSLSIAVLMARSS